MANPMFRSNTWADILACEPFRVLPQLLKCYVFWHAGSNEFRAAPPPLPSVDVLLRKESGSRSGGGTWRGDREGGIERGDREGGSRGGGLTGGRLGEGRTTAPNFIDDESKSDYIYDR